MKVLIVEDSEDLRTLLVNHLEELGVKVDSAEHGVQALDIYDPTIHCLVITDLEMPIMDGLKLGKALKSKSPGFGVWLHSSHADDLSIQRLGLFDKYYSKPSNILQMLEDASNLYKEISDEQV